MSLFFIVWWVFFQSNNGVRIHYEVVGRGEPVILVHGWAADASMWSALSTDLSRDHQVITMDCRGHGQSDKPHDSAAYGDEMVKDVVRLMDALKLKKAHIIGYSMGGSIVAKMLTEYPDRFLTAVLGGSTGFRSTDVQEAWEAGLIKSLQSGMPLSDAMIANRPPGFPEPSPQQREMMHRMDATQDSKALGAQRLGNPGLWVSDDALRHNKIPTLIAVGSLNSPERFKDAEKNVGASHLVIIEGARHGSVPDDPAFIREVREFLTAHQRGR